MVIPKNRLRERTFDGKMASFKDDHRTIDNQLSKSKMSSIVSLRKLVESLTIEEKKLCRNFLHGFTIRGENAENKNLALFNILASEEQGDLSERDVEFLLYGEKNFDAFVKLKFRLRNKVLESLIVDVNIERTGAYGECSRVLHTIRKKIIQAQIIKGRGLHDFAAMLLEEVLQQAKKYELYDEFLSALKYLIQIEAFNKNPRSIEKLLSLHQKYSFHRDALFNAQTNFFLLIGEGGLTGWHSRDLAKVKSTIDEIQIQYRKTGSATVAFYLFSLEVHYYQEIGHFLKAGRVLKRMADLIEHHIVLFSPQRLAFALANLAWNNLHLRRFKQAITLCNDSLKLLKAGSFSYYQALETLFYAEFYSGKYLKALSIIDRIIKKTKNESAKFRNSRREYLRVCTLFMLGRTQEVSTFFIHYNQIEDDKDGWNVGVRLLNIMTDIEQGRIDTADSRIETIRKHLKKINSSTGLRPRQRLIYEVLRELERSSFNFKDVYSKMHEAINNLRSVGDKYAWEILSPKLIIFEEWFVAKALGIPFRKQNIPAYKEKHTLIEAGGS